MRICICGGGSQAHISAGVIGSNPEHTIDILTRRPKEWSHDFTAIDLTGKEYHATLNTITDNPEEVVPHADVVYICVPGDAVTSMLEKIKPYLTDDSIIGSPFGGSGFFLQLFATVGTEVKAFALQRVPFTGRPREYGHSANLKGYKPYLKVACHNIEDPEKMAKTIQDWYNTPTYPMSHFLDATLSNSNPLLHPCRMYIMFKNWTPERVYTRIPYLYNTEWNDESSECWLKCDDELRQIINKLPMDSNAIPSILEYYECDGVESLTKKMQSIEPFKTVLAHMIEVPGGYKIDSEVRYFTEDIPYGLLMIKAFGEMTETPTPEIDTVLEWAQRIMGKEYITNGHINQTTFDGELAFLHPDNLKKALTAKA